SPSGGKSSVTAPDFSRAAANLMTRVPKPACVGASQRGPPVSFHSISTRSPSGTGLCHQLRLTFPRATDSAPYLSALVASSWMASAIAPPVSSETSSGVPSMEMREPWSSMNGASVARAISPNSSETLPRAITRSAAALSACNRPVSLERNRSTAGSLRGLELCASDPITVNRFLSRCRNSPITIARQPAFMDVGEDRHPFARVAARIVDRHRARREPAPVVRGRVPDANFGGVSLRRIHRPALEHQPAAIVFMDALAPGVAPIIRPAHTRDLGPSRLRFLDVAVRIGRPHHARRRAHQLPVTVLVALHSLQYAAQPLGEHHLQRSRAHKRCDIQPLGKVGHPHGPGWSHE